MNHSFGAPLETDRKTKASAETASLSPSEVRAPEGHIAFTRKRLPIQTKGKGAYLFYAHNLKDVIGIPAALGKASGHTRILAERHYRTSKRPGPTQPGISAAVKTSVMTSHSTLCTQLN